MVDKFIELLNNNLEYSIIPDELKNGDESLPLVTYYVKEEKPELWNDPEYEEILVNDESLTKEKTSRGVNSRVRFIVYGNNREESRMILREIQDAVIFKLRFEMIRSQIGLVDVRPLKDKSGLLQQDGIVELKYQGDIDIFYTVINDRVSIPIEHVDVKMNKEEIKL